jgi:hypothetical protein
MTLIIDGIRTEKMIEIQQRLAAMAKVMME